MDISFVPLNRNRNRDNRDESEDPDNEELQLSTRNFYSSIPALFNLAASSQSQQSQLRQSMPSIYALDYFKHTKPVDQSVENIKEFADNFKDIKIKLTKIQETITLLEKRKELIKTTYEDLNKKITEFFGLVNSQEFIAMLAVRAFEMIKSLELEKYYEERVTLLEHYNAAVPLLTQVKDEFFSDQVNIGNCPICYEKNISYTLQNCGHCLCDDCKKKIGTNCFLCRAHISKITRIYIS